MAQAQVRTSAYSHFLSFKSYGTILTIQTNDPAILDFLPGYLPPGWQPVTSARVDQTYTLLTQPPCPEMGEPLYQLHRSQDLLVQHSSLEYVLDYFDSDLRLQIGILTPDKLFVHAGVVGWQGKAIVIPGRSFSGKSTLVVALVQAGATYYSDEYAVFDSSGLVHPYARPLLIRQTSGETLKQRCPVDTIGGQAGTTPLPVGLIVHTHYQAEAQWQPRPLSAGEAVMALFDNTIVARLRPEFVLTTLPQAVANALALQGERGETETVVPDLLQRLEQWLAP